MCRCAARGCKRKVRTSQWDTLPDGAPTTHHLCYSHGYWYAVTQPSDYQHLCTTVFPLWSAGDITLWLEWCGM